MSLLLGSLGRNNGRLLSGNVAIADFRSGGIVAEHLLVFSTSESGAMHAVVVDPEVVEDKENDVGEVGEVVEGAVVDHLEELAHAGDHAHGGSGESAGSPRLANDLVLLVEDAGHVHAHSKNGVPKEGDPGEAALQKHVGNLHANVGVDALVGVGPEDVSRSASSLRVKRHGLSNRSDSRVERRLHALENETTDEQIAHQARSFVAGVEVIDRLHCEQRVEGVRRRECR